MARPDTSAYKTFTDITDRLDEIVSAVRDKDASLERSLDLFDEAIALGSKAVEMVDKVEFSDEERARLEGGEAPAADAGSPGNGDAPAADAADEAASAGDDGATAPTDGDAGSAEASPDDGAGA